MGHCFSHLTLTDRYRIEDALQDGKKPQEIADKLHVHVSTIYREIKRARMVHRNSDWTEEISIHAPRAGGDSKNSQKFKLLL